MPTHHPAEDLLVAYASGSLPEPPALLVATHLALCPACRRLVAEYEELGGALLEDVDAEPLADGALDALLAKLEAPAPNLVCPPPAATPASDERLPRPLRDYLDGPLEGLAWSKWGGLSQTELLPARSDFTTRLMRINAGTAMPPHTHKGQELTLVLAGGFSDAAGHYLLGDVATADSTVNHRPIADPGAACLCLAVTDAPLRLTGPISRMLNPFLRL